MLKTQISSRLPLILGLLAPPIKEQVEGQGLTLANHGLWEQRHAALNLLSVGCLLTDAEILRITQRLMKGISQDCYFEQAVKEAEAEVAVVTTAPSSLAPCTGACTGELEAYLAMGGVTAERG
jgi:hypothetical protein